MNKINYTGDETLDVMSKYAINRNKFIEGLIKKNLRLDESTSSKRVLDFGAGKGEFINRLITMKNLELIAVENETEYLKELSAKVKIYNSIDDVPAGLDCIYLIDVLEHLDDDQSYLKKFYEKLKSGGRIFIYVPARMELYSSFDKAIGHYRRYSRIELKDKIESAGFTIEKINYHEILGYIASRLNKLFNNSSHLNVSAVKFYDRFLVPSTNFIEEFIRVPIGKSLFVSAIRKN